MSIKRKFKSSRNYFFTLMCLIIMFGILVCGCPSYKSRDAGNSSPGKNQSSAPPGPFKMKDAVHFGPIPSDWKPFKIDVEGDYAYIVDAAFIDNPERTSHNEKPSSVQIVDISNPRNPTISGSISVEGKGWDIAVKNRFVYVATSNGLLTIDAHDPRKSEIVNSFSTTDHTSNVFVQNSYLYLVDSSRTLRVFNLKNPAKPERVYTKKFDSKTQMLGFMDIDSEYAYISGYPGFQIYDLSDPANPEWVGSIDNGGFPVVKHEDYLYVNSVTDQKLHEITINDISNPKKPRKRGSFSIDDRPIEITTQDNKLFVFCSDGTVLAYDISRPGYPVLLAKRTTGIKTDAVWFDGENIISLLMSGSFHVSEFGWGMDKEHELNMLSTIEAPRSITNFVLKGNHIFAVGDPPGLYCYEVSNPSDLQLISKTALPGGVKDIVVAGDFVYVKNANPMNYECTSYRAGNSPKESKLRIFNIKNPEKPIFISSVDLPENADKIATDGNTLIVQIESQGYQDELTGLSATDVANPDNPGSIKPVLNGVFARDYEIHEGIFYIINPSKGFQIYTIDSSSAFKLISELSEFKSASGLTVSGEKAYIAQGNVKVVDISNPYKPLVLESVNTRGDGKDLIISDHNAFVKRGMFGIYIVDLRDSSKQPEMMNLGKNSHDGNFVVKGEYVIYSGSEGLRTVLKSIKIPDRVLN